MSHFDSFDFTQDKFAQYSAFSPLVISVLFAKQYIQVRALPLTGNPKSFVESFNPEGQEPASLEVGGLEGRVIHSPFFPYVKLKTQNIVQGQVILNNILSFKHGPFLEYLLGRNIKIPEKTKFYGPFKPN